MSRKVFDILASTGGAVAVVVLVVAGGLLTWGHTFVNSNVRDQLAQQQINFPPMAAFAHSPAGREITPSMIPSVSQYAGHQLLTGTQAEAYANHFIAVHLSQMPYGGVYSKVSAASIANPSNAGALALLWRRHAHAGTSSRAASRNQPRAESYSRVSSTWRAPRAPARMSVRPGSAVRVLARGDRAAGKRFGECRSPPGERVWTATPRR